MKRGALLFVGLASPLILLAFAIGSGWAEFMFAGLVAAFPVALIVIGASRNESLGPLLIPLVTLWILLETSLFGMLVLRDQGVDGLWFAGLPITAAIQIYGLWLAAQVLVSVAFVITFDRFSLRQGDLDRLRVAAAARRQQPLGVDEGD